MIVFFHRPKRENPKPQDGQPPQEEQNIAPAVAKNEPNHQVQFFAPISGEPGDSPEGNQARRERDNKPVDVTHIADPVYGIKAIPPSIMVQYKFAHMGKEHEGKITEKLEKNKLYTIFFDSQKNKLNLRERGSSTILFYEARLNTKDYFYLGTICYAKDDILIYLRGRTDDVKGKGIKNVLLAEEEASFDGFRKYSKDAKKIIEKALLKEQYLADVDPFQTLSYLEAQVDVLTRIILESGIASKSAYFDFIKAAERVGIHHLNTKDKLLAKLQKKAHFRKLQKEFYEKRMA